jgi:hypothetical protein
VVSGELCNTFHKTIKSNDYDVKKESTKDTKCEDAKKVKETPGTMHFRRQMVVTFVICTRFSALSEYKTLGEKVQVRPVSTCITQKIRTGVVPPVSHSLMRLFCCLRVAFLV